jgi:hypothetical protein
MRRIVGLVLVGIGVMLIALAVALPTYVYPRIAKVPDNPDQKIVAEGTGITALVPSLVVKGGNGLLTDQKAVVTRRVVGVEPPNGQEVPEGQAFYRLAFDARVENPELQGNDNLMQAYVEGVSFDGKTGQATNCCGDFLATDAEKPEGDPIKHSGISFKFPFNVQRNTDYQWWDANIRAAMPARYDGTEKIMGLQTYRFVQTINDEVIAQQSSPGAFFGSDEQTVTADRVYATVRTLWVEPYSGALIKGAEQVNQRLVYNGKEVPVFRGSLAFNDATVKDNVDEYKSAASGLKFVTRTGPIGGWVLGPILVLVGLTMIALSRRESSDDDWDEWDDDEDVDDDTVDVRDTDRRVDADRPAGAPHDVTAHTPRTDTRPS